MKLRIVAIAILATIAACSETRVSRPEPAPTQAASSATASLESHSTRASAPVDSSVPTTVADAVELPPLVDTIPSPPLPRRPARDSAWTTRSNDECGFNVLYEGRIAGEAWRGCSTLYVDSRFWAFGRRAWMFTGSVEGTELRRTDDAGETWSILAADSSLRDVAFLDRAHGVAIGWSGREFSGQAHCGDAVFHTTDGGSTWSPPHFLGDDRFGAGTWNLCGFSGGGKALTIRASFIPADTRASEVRAVRAVLESHDSGITWRIPTAYLTARWFAHADLTPAGRGRWWLSATDHRSSGDLLRSDDDGETWEVVPTGVRGARVTVEAARGNQVWGRVDAPGSVADAALYSSDAGRTWKARLARSSRRSNRLVGLEVQPAAVAQMSFVSGRVGFGIPSYNWNWRRTEGRALVARTIDGGSTWHVVSELPPRTTRLAFVGPRLGYAYGPALYATTDGGGTWHEIDRGLSARFRTGFDQLDIESRSVWAIGRSCDTCASRLVALGTHLDVHGGLAIVELSLPRGVDDVALTRADRSLAVITFRFLRGGQVRHGSAVTVDGGRHWLRRASCPSTPNPDQFVGGRVTIGPSGSWWLFCRGERGFGAQPKAIYRSRDQAKSWELVSASEHALRRDPTGELAIGGSGGEVDAVSDRSAYLFLGAKGGVARTVDGGRTWKSFSLCHLSPCGLTSMGDEVWFATGTGLWHAKGDGDPVRLG